MPTDPRTTTPSTTPSLNGEFPTTSDSCGCTSCGPEGCYDPVVVDSQFACCGANSGAGCYIFADGLYWSRDDGEIAASNFFSLNDFSNEYGIRFTLGVREDSIYGSEVTYFGTLQEVSERAELNDPFNRLGSVFIPSGGFAGFEVSSFFNANRQVQVKSSEIHSLEYNRIRWGWDVFKVLAGMRYIYMDDEFSYFSRNNTGSGRFDMASINNLLGGHIGGEFFYDVGYRTSVSLTSKFGAYWNLAAFDTLLNNNGFFFIDRDIEDSHIASSIELGFLAHYQVNPNVRLRLGFDLLWLWGIFTVNNNFPRENQSNQINPPILPPPELVTPRTGTDLNTNAEGVLWDGLSLGVEIFR
jgi:hypothetical protein